jgi:hypothetical protein
VKQELLNLLNKLRDSPVYKFTTSKISSDELSLLEKGALIGLIKREYLGESVEAFSISDLGKLLVEKQFLDLSTDTSTGSSKLSVSLEGLTLETMIETDSVSFSFSSYPEDLDKVIGFLVTSRDKIKEAKRILDQLGE